MKYGDTGWQWGTAEQVDMFQDYLDDTAELQDRHIIAGKAVGYDEKEWEAFCYGWNAALQHYKIVP